MVEKNNKWIVYIYVDLYRDKFYFLTTSQNTQKYNV